MARQVADSLIARGDVPRSSIGASFRHLQNTGIAEGALVDSVDADGPAYAAGLPWDEAMVNALGVTVDEFDQGWREWIADQALDEAA